MTHKQIATFAPRLRLDDSSEVTEAYLAINDYLRDQFSDPDPGEMLEAETPFVNPRETYELPEFIPEDSHDGVTVEERRRPVSEDNPYDKEEVDVSFVSLSLQMDYDQMERNRGQSEAMIEDILTECDEAQTAYIVRTGDHEWSGEGWVYQLNEGILEKIDTFSGAEGSEAKDVVKDIEREYGFRPKTPRL